MNPMDFRFFFTVFFLLMIGWRPANAAGGLACNLGTQTTHLLPPEITVRLLKENGFDKLKLFEADPRILGALNGSGIQVMVGIPNYMLQTMAESRKAAQQWVARNVTDYLALKVDIRYVAVGNEPLLQSYNGSFVNTTFPALRNIQEALNKAGVGGDIKATVPLNGDIFYSHTGFPSGGIFLPRMMSTMVPILKQLNQSNAPLTMNVYPFYSLIDNPNFPVDYAFFDGVASPLVDGSLTYTNTLEGQIDTLYAALNNSGFPSMPIIVGEVGWPSDGNPVANNSFARRFNQGLIKFIKQGKGTPRKSKLPDIYLFSLMDEDGKGIEPGDFERHWGILNFDGSLKYNVDFGGGKNLMGAEGVEYYPRQWCVMAPGADADAQKLNESMIYACDRADCTSISNGSSCGGLDLRSTASYVFNKYFQTMNQTTGSCGFGNLATVTKTEPSFNNGTCKFEVMFNLAGTMNKLHGTGNGTSDSPGGSPDGGSSAGGSPPSSASRKMIGFSAVLLALMVALVA